VLDSILVAGLFGGLMGVLGALITYRLRETKPQLAQLLVVAFVVASLPLGRLFVLPEFRVWRGMSEANEAFDQNRLFVLLERDHPEIRGSFKQMLEAGLRSGMSREDAHKRGYAWGEETAGKLIPEYLPRTSDQALVAYVAATVGTLDEMAKRRDHACFVFLFGNIDERAGLSLTALPPDRLKALQSASEEVILKAGPLPIKVAPKRQEELMQTLVTRLVEKHGDRMVKSFEQLEEPSKPGNDRDEVCFATREMYREAIAMKAPDNAELLRGLFAEL
jgi:hypothetical protein